LDKSKQLPSEIDENVVGFAKHYSRYLQQVLATNRLLAQNVEQQCRLNQRRDEDGTFHQHDLAGELLLRQLSALQTHEDALMVHLSIHNLNPILEEKRLSTELNVHETLLTELFRLFAFDIIHYEQEYKHTMDRLLAHFELMSKRHCSAALALYRAMPERANRLQAQLNEFNELVYKSFFGHSLSLSSLTPVNLPHLDQLETHLANLNSKPKRK
jgi:AraC-like DNA-binding protein